MGAAASQIYFSIISHNSVAMMSCLGLKRRTLDSREKKTHTNHMMYDYSRIKHKMCGIKYRESDKDGKKLDFSV